MPHAEPLSRQEIDRRLADLPGWELSPHGSVLARMYRLPHLRAAILAVHIAGIQDELNHHSDLVLGYDTLGVSITTHEAGGNLTAKDFELARRIAEIAPTHGAR